MTLAVGAGAIGWGEVRLVLDGAPKLRLAPAARAAVRRSRAVIERALASGAVIYGVTTGFGKLSDTRIPREQALALQRNLILSHALPLGDALPEPMSRLVFYLRIASLARGHSGVTERMLDHMIAMFNRGAIPVVHDGGSVGASGDLAPLALVGAAMIGEWKCHGRSLRQAGLRPYTFLEKEALSVINGTQLTAAILARAILEAKGLVCAADLAAAMSLEALKGSMRPFDPRVARAKPHPGMAVVSRNVRRLLRASGILESHRDCAKVQDAYSLRCVPQVHGAVRDALAYAESVVLREINSAVDNPLVFPPRDVISAGNFHAQSLAHAADSLTSALATLANISERRIERLTNPQLSELPPFLVAEGGLHSGMMGLQVAAASLAAENRVLSYPSSVTSIPTSAAKEDHVSMGPTAAKNAARAAANTRTVLALETLCAAQGLEFLKPLRPGRGVEAAWRRLRRDVRPLVRDRLMGRDVRRARDLLGDLTAAAERAAGPLA